MFARTTLRAFFTAFNVNLSDSSPCVQLPTTVKETYKRGQQLAAEKDAQGENLVVVPVSQVKEGALPSASGAGGRGGLCGCVVRGAVYKVGTCSSRCAAGVLKRQ